MPPLHWPSDSMVHELDVIYGRVMEWTYSWLVFYSAREKRLYSVGHAQDKFRKAYITENDDWNFNEEINIPWSAFTIFPREQRVDELYKAATSKDEDATLATHLSKRWLDKVDSHRKWNSFDLRTIKGQAVLQLKSLIDDDYHKEAYIVFTSAKKIQYYSQEYKEYKESGRFVKDAMFEQTKKQFLGSGSTDIPKAEKDLKDSLNGSDKNDYGAWLRLSGRLFTPDKSYWNVHHTTLGPEEIQYVDLENNRLLYSRRSKPSKLLSSLTGDEHLEAAAKTKN